MGGALPYEDGIDGNQESGGIDQMAVF